MSEKTMYDEMLEDYSIKIIKFNKQKKQKKKMKKIQKKM